MYQALIKNSRFIVSCLLLLGLFFLCQEIAFAAGEMPWESPLKSVSDSLTGDVAGFIALIAIFVSGALLIFGGELSEFARRMIMLVLVLSLVVSASSILNVLYNK